MISAVKEPPRIAILIVSCDKYSDLWDTCALAFNKFWPDCPYDKFLVSNEKVHEKAFFRSILVGKDKTWSYGLNVALESLRNQYDYVFTMVEDYFFFEKVDSAYVSRMFDSFIASDGNFLSLFKLPSRLSRYNEYFGELENNIPYRHSCGFTLWKVSTLIDLLDVNENAWEFEIYGVRRSFNYSGFFASWKYYRTMNLVVKGRLVPSEYRRLKKCLPGIEIKRSRISYFEELKNTITTKLVFAFLRYIPKVIKNKIYFYKNRVK